jgi:hypothetical membrane protein
MNKKSWKEWIFTLNIIIGILWFILSTLGMILYTGGTSLNPNARGYSFWSNYFSDAGMTKGYSGQSNIVSCILWNTALVLVGIGMIIFVIALQTFFNKTKTERRLSIIGSIFGIIGGIFFTGIALTPWDLYPKEHDMLYIPAFMSTFLMAIFFCIVIFLNKAYPNRYALTFLIFAVILSVYIVLVIIGPGSETTEGLIIQATGQKLVSYAFLISLFIESYGALKLEKAQP